MKFRLARLGAKSDFWARFYYAFVDKSFTRENRAVLKGVVMHNEGFMTEEYNEYFLRRSIHRLEKGVIMPDRKEVFAQKYIFETVKAFVQEAQKLDNDPKLVKWANDVLNMYFSFVKPEGVIKDAYKLYSENYIESSKPYYIPHKKIITEKKHIKYDDFLNFCKQRSSCRIYQKTPVSRDLLKKAFDAALHSPSACNRQPYEFYVFDKPDDIAKLIKIPGGASGFDKEIPVLIFLIGDLSAFFDERDRHLIYIDGGLITMTLMLALETLGLSSCALNLPDIEEKEKELEKQLKLPKHKRGLLALTVGYPELNCKIPCSKKKSFSQTIKYK